MTRIVYPRGLSVVASGWTSHTLRILLERSTSGYTPNIDHDFLDDFTGGGGVEISVASYARQTLGSLASAYDSTKNQQEFDCADVSFGSLESGQIVRAVIVYRQTGGDDSTPANDELVLYDDGKIDVVLAANASSGATTIYVQPLEANLPNGTALDFGGGGTCTLQSAASRGDRSLSGSALGANRTAGATDTDVATDSILPATLQNGPFSYQIHADGLLILAQRGHFAT